MSLTVRSIKLKNKFILQTPICEFPFKMLASATGLTYVVVCFVQCQIDLQSLWCIPCSYRSLHKLYSIENE